MRHLAAVFGLAFVTNTALAAPAIDTYFAPIYTASLKRQLPKKSDIELIQNYSPAFAFDAIDMAYSSFITEDGYRYIFRFKSVLGRLRSTQLFVIDAHGKVEELKIVKSLNEVGLSAKDNVDTFTLESGATLKIATSTSSISLPAMQERIVIPSGSNSRCQYLFREKALN